MRQILLYYKAGAYKRCEKRDDIEEYYLPNRTLKFRGSPASRSGHKYPPWFLISSFFGLGIEYTLEPLQANFKIGISRIGARIMPSRGGERDPVTSIGSGWPDNHRV